MKTFKKFLEYVCYVFTDFPALQRMALQNGSAYGVSQSPDINVSLLKVLCRYKKALIHL